MLCLQSEGPVLTYRPFLLLLVNVRVDIPDSQDETGFVAWMPDTEVQPK